MAAARTVTVLLFFTLLLSAGALAVNDCQVALRGNAPAGYVAVMSLAAPDNAHAALASFTTFNYELYCPSEIAANSNNVMLRIANDGGQGHVAAPSYTSFSTTVSGSWSDCRSVPSCAPTQVCLVKFANDGGQGHAGSCQTSTFGSSICCCPYGYHWTTNPSGQCVQDAQSLSVKLTCPSTATVGSTVSCTISDSYDGGALVWDFTHGATTLDSGTEPAYFTGTNHPFSKSESVTFTKPGSYTYNTSGALKSWLLHEHPIYRLKDYYCFLPDRPSQERLYVRSCHARVHALRDQRHAGNEHHAQPHQPGRKRHVL